MTVKMRVVSSVEPVFELCGMFNVLRCKDGTANKRFSWRLSRGEELVVFIKIPFQL